MKSLAVDAMTLAKLVHEEDCEDIDDCDHCVCEFKEGHIKATGAAILLKELYEIASSQVISKEKRKKNKLSVKRRSGKLKQYPASMFSKAGIPNGFRYKPQMVSLN